MYRTIILIIVILILLFLMSYRQKEGFLNDYCSSHNNCSDCANASGCSWCPNASICMKSTILKSTDKQCNQMNTITASFRCTETDIKEHTNANSHITPYDFTQFRNKIADKIPPPNTYTIDNINVSPQDILSNMNNIRNDIDNYERNLPGIIASTVETQIRPMVKGVLSENYYIQGFKDMSTPCIRHTSCNSCVNDSKCGWDINTLTCNERGPNKTWYITQQSRCVTTPSTKRLMITEPN